MVDVATLQQVAVAQGGTRGFAVLATADGRLLISQSHEVDVLEPVVPPAVIAINPPPDGVDRRCRWRSSTSPSTRTCSPAPATDSSSVTDPANYTLVGQSTGAATIQSVRYNPSTRTALLVVSGLVADHVHADGRRFDPECQPDRLAGALCHALHGGQRPVAVRQADLHQHAIGPEHRHGLVRRDDQEHQPVRPARSVVPDPRPGAGLQRHAAERRAELERKLADQPEQLGARRRRARRRARARPVRHVTINDPNGQEIAYTAEVSGMPPAASAPVFDSTPVTSVTAGAVYTYQVQAHDPDGSTPGFVLVERPAGHDGRSGHGPHHLEHASRRARPSCRSTSTPTTPAAASRSQHFVIQVAGGSHPPVIGPLPSQVSGKEGQPLVLPVSATDPDGRPLVYWADHLPGGASFDPTTHTLLWEPDYGQAGTYNDVTFYVSDGVSTVSSSIALLIAPAPPPPQLAAVPDQTVREGDHLRFTLQGSDADGGPVTYSSADLPENATLDPNTGVFDWPIGYDQAGTLTVPFTVTSSSGVSTTQMVTYTVLPAPAAPIFSPLQSWQVERRPADLVRRIRRRSAQPDVRAADAAAGRLALAVPDHAADGHLQRQRPAAGRDVRPGHRAL